MTAINPAEQKYRELRRTQIIQELGALEDLMIALGELKERTIVPRRKQEYFESTSVVTVSGGGWGGKDLGTTAGNGKR